ncbi:unnamed protein product [Callosobruchus maculatus]|uniref:Uncharacterized protein n=1 Tax=Callosobruchus maculatus TaxID=64391 RepID=A0A653DMA9_CALMS|nr:unnamed protein product [Callosobruchus maculatus]
MRYDGKMISSRFVKILTNFIKYKEPMPSMNSFFENITWMRFDTTDLKYVNFNTYFSVQSNPRKYRSIKKILDRYLIKPIKFY